MCVKFIRVGTHRKEGDGNGGRDEETPRLVWGGPSRWMTMVLLELGTGLPQQPAACPTGAEGESSPGLTARFAEGRARGQSPWAQACFLLSPLLLGCGGGWGVTDNPQPGAAGAGS